MSFSNKADKVTTGIDGYLLLTYALNLSARSFVPVIIESASMLQAYIKGFAVIKGSYLTIAISSKTKGIDLTGSPLSNYLNTLSHTCDSFTVMPF
jgi:hypothetical protein